MQIINFFFLSRKRKHKATSCPFFAYCHNMCYTNNKISQRTPPDEIAQNSSVFFLFPFVFVSVLFIWLVEKFKIKYLYSYINDIHNFKQPQPQVRMWFVKARQRKRRRDRRRRNKGTSAYKTTESEEIIILWMSVCFGC